MDLVVKVHGEDTLTPAINKAKGSVDGLVGSSAKLEQIKTKFDKISNSVAPLKKKLAETKKLMAELNLDGLSNTDVFIQMAEQAGAYSDAMGDASTAVKQFANDNRGLQTCIEGMSLLTGVAGAATGAMNLLGIENENVQQAMLKVQSVMTILNSLQTISNVLNKDSALMLTLKSAATTGATVTTGALTAALSKQAIVEALVTLKQKISTAAQIAWNVAKAIGMAMLGNYTGLALLAVGAIVGLTMATMDDTDANEENAESKNKVKKATETLKEAQEEAANTIVSEEAKVIASYKGLQSQWQRLTSEQEKSQWIEDNASKFQQLGYDIDNTSDAEDFFTKNSSKVIAALQARARAAALYELYLKALQKQYELNHQTTVHYEWEYSGEIGGEDYNRKKEEARQRAFAQLAEDRRAQNEFVAQLDRDLQAARAASDEAAAQVNQRGHRNNSRGSSRGGSGRSSSGGQTTEEKVILKWEEDDHSLAFAQKYLRQLEDEFANMDLSLKDGSVERMQEAILAVKKEVEARKLIIEPVIEFPEGSLEYANQMLSNAQDVLRNADLTLITPEQLEQAKAEVEKWAKEVEAREITLGLRVEEPKESEATIKGLEENKYFEKGSDEDKRASYRNAQSIISQLQSDVRIGIIGGKEALAQVQELNKDLESLGLKPFNMEINLQTGELEEAMSDIEKAQLRMQEFQNTMTSWQDSMNNVGSTLSSVGSLFDEDGAKVMDFAANTITAVAQILPQLMALFGSKAAVAMVSGVESASGLPFPANIAAIAAVVATLTGVIASAAKLKSKKYASGGIVGGATTIGDYNLARVNSGEMILNGMQQKRLFRMLNSGGATDSNGNPTYTVKIKGSDLHLAMSNYAKTKKKIF